MQTDTEKYIVQQVNEGATMQQARENKKQFVTDTFITGWEASVDFAEKSHAFSNPDVVVISTHKIKDGKVIFTDFHYNQMVNILQLSRLLKRTKYVFWYNIKTKEWEGRAYPALEWRAYDASPKPIRWLAVFLLTITGIRLYKYVMLQLALFLTGIIDYGRRNGLL